MKLRKTKSGGAEFSGQKSGVRIQEVELRNQKWMWGPEYKRIKKFTLQSRRRRDLGEA